jgi:DNA mismatch repair protein MutL
VGPPSRTRPDGRLEQVFVNGRFVRDRTVSHALREAFRDLLPPGNHRPVAFLFFSVDPAFVDVNVHPAKAEVRWRESAAVHSLVHRAVRAALEAASPGVAVPVGGLRRETVEAAEFAFTHGVGKVPFDRVAPSAPWGVEARHDASGHAHAGTHPVLPEPTCGGAPAVTSRLRPLGQALGTYLVFEGEEEIVLVDQHALHERVLFDRIEARLKEEGRLEVQRLLVPVVVSLSAAESAALAEEAELLASLGWIVEPFGEGSVAVHGLPAVLRRPQPEAALLEVLRLVEEGRRDGADATHLISAAIDRLACRSAVMAGDTVHPEEALALLEEAERLDHSHTCPHGRPTRLTLRRSDLERWFHR